MALDEEIWFVLVNLPKEIYRFFISCKVGKFLLYVELESPINSIELDRHTGNQAARYNVCWFHKGFAEEVARSKKDTCEIAYYIVGTTFGLRLTLWPLEKYVLL